MPRWATQPAGRLSGPGARLMLGPRRGPQSILDSFLSEAGQLLVTNIRRDFVVLYGVFAGIAVGGHQHGNPSRSRYLGEHDHDEDGERR